MLSKTTTARVTIRLAVMAFSLVATPAGQAWSWPVGGHVLRPFSFGSDPYAGGQHRGIDIGADAAEAIRAPAGGTVTFVGTVPTNGLTITIATADGYAVTLTHVGAFAREEGRVRRRGRRGRYRRTERGGGARTPVRAPRDPRRRRRARLRRSALSAACARGTGTGTRACSCSCACSRSGACSCSCTGACACARVGAGTCAGTRPCLGSQPRPAPASPSAADPAANPATIARRVGLTVVHRGGGARSTAPAASVPRPTVRSGERCRRASSRCRRRGDEPSRCARCVGRSCHGRFGRGRHAHCSAGAEAGRHGPGARLARRGARRRRRVRRLRRGAARRSCPNAMVGYSAPPSSWCSPRSQPGSPSRAHWRASVESTGMSYYVTTPIYYVNSTPHIGHAYTTIAADILVRHHRQRGEDTFFLTGVDEHASKVWRVAAEQGLEPKEYADRIAVTWRELPARLNASNDFFIRTTDEGHKQFVQDFLQRIYDNGDVYQGVYAGLYCVGCEAFKSRVGARRRQVSRPRHRARVDRGAQLVLPPLRVPGEASGDLRRAAGLRPARLPRERSTQLHRGRPPGLFHQPRGPALGHPDPVGSGAGRLRLGRRARQLPERAQLRASGRGPAGTVLAARSAHPGQGHPSLPLCLLARAAALGRLRRAKAAVRARLPESRQPQDLEVARQRRRPASTSSPSTAPTRCASGRSARSPSARTETSSSRRFTSATSASWRTTSATSSLGRRR